MFVVIKSRWPKFTTDFIAFNKNLRLPNCLCTYSVYFLNKSFTGKFANRNYIYYCILLPTFAKWLVCVNKHIVISYSSVSSGVKTIDNFLLRRPKFLTFLCWDIFWTLFVYLIFIFSCNCCRLQTHNHCIVLHRRKIAPTEDRCTRVTT